MAFEQRTVWQLANLAGCADPDEHDGIGFDLPAGAIEDRRVIASPGANFLRSVEDAVREAFDYHEGQPGDDWHEVADGAVPVYTHALWSTFVDLAAYNEDPSELGCEADDMTRAAGVCLYMIAERLAMALAEEYDEETCDGCGVPLADDEGEGWNGYCGSCADKRYNEEDE
jgi:hypothetical protein